MKIGIVGVGGFGKLAMRVLSEANEVLVTDILPAPPELGRAKFATLSEVAECSIVILAVNLEHLEGVLRDITPHLRPGTLVMDVCSVKMKPIEMMVRLLPNNVSILGTHPLFGPQSAKNGLSGHKIVLCPVRIEDTKLEKIRSFLSSLGLNVVDDTAEHHDHEMAFVQGLTHFVARAMIESGVKESPLSTKAFDSLFGVLETLNPGTWELFKTIELGNPFAKEVRQKFLKALLDLERKLKE